MIHSLEEKIIVNNGSQIPGLGLGVFQIPDEETEAVVSEGILQGYRLIDTAQIYGNEAGTGAGIKKGMAAANIAREELFVTSKLWNNHLSYDETITAFENSLSLLGLDYLDLYLIHWPGTDAFETSWKALEDLYKAGKVKAIGVSNFQIQHLEKLLSFATVLPVINQIELHPKLNQQKLRDFCKQHNIHIQAWSPLMQGRILNDPLLQKIGAAHQRSSAQIVLRWAVQQDILLVVKSVQSARMKSNAQLFDFELSDEEMVAITNLNENLRVGPDPDTFDF
ncbi:aldo/keto reductase [Enterococcus sp. LJL128]